MKDLLAMCCLVFCAGTLFNPSFGQQVAISDGSHLPDATAILDLNSHSRGILIPRLSLTERQQITQPAKALLIYNTSTNQFEVNVGNSQHPDWQSIVTVGTNTDANRYWLLGGNVIDTVPSQIGTINNRPFSLKTNNLVRIYIDSVSGNVGVRSEAPKASLHIGGTDAIIIPSGSTQQRPIAPVPGMIRFNNETGRLEGYTTTGWKSFN